MSQKLPVVWEPREQEEFIDMKEGVEKQNLDKNEDIETEIENVVIIEDDLDAANSEKENLSEKSEEIIGRQPTKPENHEQHPKKRVALASETSRQQHSSHRGRNSRKDHRRITSSSEDEDYVSDDIDDDSEPGQRRRHSQTSATGSRRRGTKDDDHTINYDEYVSQLKEPPVQANTIANTIQTFLTRVLQISIRLIEEPEIMNVSDEEFPLSEHMQDAVSRILGDENATFYRRFDNRFDSRRLDVGVNSVMMGIGEYDDSSDIIAMEQPFMYAWYLFPIPKLEPRISQYQYEAINTFVSNGGLDAVLRALGYVDETTRPIRTSTHRFNNLDLKDVHGVIRMIHKIGPYVPNNVDFRQIVMKVANCVYDQIINIPEEWLVRQDKKLIPNIVHMVTSMILNLPSSVTGTEVPDEQQVIRSAQLKIDIAARLLKTSRLDLRLSGLNEIKEALILGLKQARVLKKSKRRGNARKRSLSVDGEDDEYAILEYIFGSNIHLEIVQRCTDILTFMIHTRTLTTHELDIVWSPIDGNQHRSIIHGVCQVLIDISDSLNQEQRNYLFQKLMKMPMSFIETQTYLLIRTLVQSTMSCVRVGGMIMGQYISFEAHRILWRILCDSSIPVPVLMNAEVLSPTAGSPTSSISTIDPEITQNACAVLTDLLQGDTRQEDRNALLNMCIDCLKRHDPGTVWALRILTRIISPPFPNPPTTTSEYLQRLITEVNLPRLFLDDLEHWTKTVKACADRSYSSFSMDLDRNSPVTATSSTISLSPSKAAILRDQLISRLQFLQWVANYETIPFFNSTAQTDVIWNCLIVDPIGKQEQDEAFSYFDHIIEYDHFTNHFFNDRLPELDVRFLSDQAFKYAKNCLLKVNAKNGRLRSTSPNPQSQNQLSIIVQGDLIGIDLIWDIALRAEEEAVGNEAIVFLSCGYTSLISEFTLQTDKKLENHNNLARQHREALVDKCVGHLFSAANGLSRSLAFSTVDSSDITMSRNEDKQDMMENDGIISNEIQASSLDNQVSNALKFKRCLEVLKSFMDLFDTKYSDSPMDLNIVRKHSMLNEAEMITVKVTITHAGASRGFEIQIHPTETILSLRQKIASRVGSTRPGMIRLITSGKELNADQNGMTLKKLKVVDRQSFMAMKRNTDVKNGLDSDKTGDTITQSDLPINMLSKYIDQFFLMLELEETYSSQIWDLLMRLPTHMKSMDALKVLDIPVKWQELFVNRSPFRLLYSLQILNWLLRDGDETQSGPEWSMRFVENGGLEYLLSLLIIRDASVNDDCENIINSQQNSVTKRACLGLLLKVISYFAVDNSSVSSIVFQQLDSKVLIAKLINIIRHCVDPSQKQVGEDLTIIRYSMKLLSCLCLRDTSALASFVEYSDLREWLITALVACESEEARNLVSQMLLQFCKDIAEIAVSDQIPASLESFLSLLWSFLPDVENYVDSSKEYFELMGNLMHFITRSTRVSLQTLYKDIKRQIKEHPIKEQFNSPNEDTVIVGLIKLMTIIVSKHPEFKRYTGDLLLDLIFHECLFQVPTIEHAGLCLPPKCKLEVSRNAALELLNQLVKECPENFLRITELYLKQLDRGEQLNDNWNYCPRTAQKASAGYVGLQNLGATCYVNSIVQQFYMNTSFRQSLFTAPVLDDNKDESLLYQLQVVFGNLQESEKKSYEATQFCHAYKDYDGQPLNVALQMDVDEYFNGLFDRLENSVSGTPQAMLLKEHFGGALVQQIKSRDCGHISEKEESFYAISCEVKNKKNVEESLELYVEGELLDGDNQYFCTKCNKPVDAIKRSCIKKLPKNLIMHLKRFDFDMELLKRVKINEYFEFPTNINMEPYTLDYLIRKESGQLDDMKFDVINKGQFEYELVGVLVHTGTADSGHYYSFIRERKPLYNDTSYERRWYQFNDSNVEIFDPKEIPKQCFGGPEYVMQWDPTSQKNLPRMFARQYNAYMLFYERVGDQDILESKSTSQDQVTKVPVDIYSSIWEENIGFLQDKNIFDPGYFQLMWSVLHSVNFDEKSKVTLNGKEIDLVLRTIQLSTEFVLGILSRAKDNHVLKDWVEFLKTLFQKHLLGCQWFIGRLIDNNPFYIQQILMSCFIQDVREQVLDLIMFVLRTLRNGDPIAYGLQTIQTVIIDNEDSPDSSMNLDSTQAQICNPKGLIVQLCESLLYLLPSAHMWWRNFEQYFYLLSYIACSGMAERIYMIKRGFIGELVKLFLLDELSPLKSRKRRMGDKFSLPPFRYLLTTLRTLLKTCDVVNIASGRELERERDPSSLTGIQTPLRLSESESGLIFERNESEDQYIFFMKQIRDLTDNGSSREIFQHFAYNNEEVSEEFINQLIRAVDTYTVDHVRPHLEIIYSLTQLQDSISHVRIEYIITEILKDIQHHIQLAKNNQNSPQIAVECLGLIEALCTSTVGTYVQHAFFNFMDDWLLEYLLISPYEIVRQRAEELFSLLIFRKLDEAQGDQAQKDAYKSMIKHYNMMLKHMDNFEQYWKATHNRRGAEPYGWRLSNIFRCMTKCLRSQKEKQMFQASYDRFSSIFISVDSARIDCDIDKKEIITFWYTATLPKYYGLLSMGCRRSREYHKKWMEAPNYYWALSSMIFGDFDDHKTDELLELMKFSADESSMFRSKVWEHVFPTLVNTATLPRKVNQILRLVQYLNRDSIEDFYSFCKYHGFEILSQYIQAIKDKHPSDENIRKCLEALNINLGIALLYQSEEGIHDYFKSWKTLSDFVVSFLTFLHPNIDNAVYVKVLEILCKFVSMKSTMDLASGIMQILIEKHSLWQRRLSNVTQEELQVKFGGIRSIFTELKLVDDESDTYSVSPPSGPSIHVYKPFLTKLRAEDLLRLHQNIYKPYLMFIKKLIDAATELKEYNKIIQLCSLIFLEMEIKDDYIFNVLLNLYEKNSNKEIVINAYRNIYFAMLVESILNSDSRLILNLSPEKLKLFKSLILIVKSSKPDMIQPIILKHIQQLAANAKVLKEKIEAKDSASVSEIIQELVMILQVLVLTLSDNFLPVDDPLRQAYLDSLKEIDSEQVKSELGQSEELAKLVNKMNLLLGQLTHQKCDDDFEVVEKTENDVVSNDENNNGNFA
ncbi:11338_t:CDS:10 [Funneliformis caledonium]|uniref:11338_t:CDS:1 n=1 Tax=Funneliformis caledonium TaxID=1117310 RepID=A0A9N8YPY7_9GLOM|nr:11338_t:CDS:10 [Funneliformis caledonium]